MRTRSPPTQVADLARLTDYESVTAERDGDGTGEGIGMLYKKTMFSKVDSGSFWLSLTPDVPSIHPEAEYLRLCLWTVLRDRKGHDFLSSIRIWTIFQKSPVLKG